jgi:hypothetical protein
LPIIKHVNKRHRRNQNREADKERGTARERGYTTAWDRFSKSHLANNPLCVYCLAQDRVEPASLVDHIEPHRGDPAKFWPDSPNDHDTFFASCCAPCHNGPKQRAERYADKTGKPVIDVLRKWGLFK